MNNTHTGESSFLLSPAHQKKLTTNLTVILHGVTGWKKSMVISSPMTKLVTPLATTMDINIPSNGNTVGS